MKMMGFLRFLLGLRLMITIMASTPVVEAWEKKAISWFVIITIYINSKNIFRDGHTYV